MAFDQVGKIMDIDDGPLDARGCEPVEHVVDQGLSADFDKRLWNSLRDRAHPFAKTGGEHDRILRHSFGHLSFR
jgi:hypothetical protein